MTSSDKNNALTRNFKTRPIEPNDLKTVNEIMKIEQFDIGLAHLTMFYNCSDKQFWNCLENDQGEIIAIDISNGLHNGIKYGFALVIVPEYRGKGISNIFTSHWRNYPNISSSTLKSVKVLSQASPCWNGKMLNMYGKVDKTAAIYYICSNKGIDILLEEIGEHNLEKVMAYDETIIKIDRKKFTRHWCLDNGAKAYCAIQNSICVGFGVLAKFTRYKGIGPLYANDDQIAVALFSKLVEDLDEDFLSVSAQSHQRVTLDFCHQLKLQFVNCEVRNCNMPALNFMDSLDMRKVYTLHDYWPA